MVCSADILEASILIVADQDAHVSLLEQLLPVPVAAHEVRAAHTELDVESREQ